MKMNQSNEDSIEWRFTGFAWTESEKVKVDENGMIIGEHKEKKGNVKTPELIQSIQVEKVYDGRLWENGTLDSASGKKQKGFDFKTAAGYEPTRMTKHAIELRKLKEKTKQAGLAK